MNDVTPEGRILGSKSSDHGGPGPYVMSAETLAGNSVVNPAGENLGQIKHIMLDVLNGRIAYAVLSFGGMMGMGDKLFAIPWQALKLDTDKERFVFDVDPERLRNAPGFDKDHWPLMGDYQWATDIHSFYNHTPYWE